MCMCMCVCLCDCVCLCAFVFVCLCLCVMCVCVCVPSRKYVFRTLNISADWTLLQPRNYPIRHLGLTHRRLSGKMKTKRANNPLIFTNFKSQKKNLLTAAPIVLGPPLYKPRRMRGQIFTVKIFDCLYFVSLTAISLLPKIHYVRLHASQRGWAVCLPVTFFSQALFFLNFQVVSRFGLRVSYQPIVSWTIDPCAQTIYIWSPNFQLVELLVRHFKNFCLLWDIVDCDTFSLLKLSRCFH